MLDLECHDANSHLFSVKCHCCFCTGMKGKQQKQCYSYKSQLSLSQRPFPYNVFHSANDVFGKKTHRALKIKGPT